MLTAHRSTGSVDNSQVGSDGSSQVGSVDCSQVCNNYIDSLQVDNNVNDSSIFVVSFVTEILS